MRNENRFKIIKINKVRKMMRLKLTFAPLVLTWLMLTLLLSWPDSRMVTLAAARVLPASIIELPASEHAVIVEKKSQTLFLYKSGQEGAALSFQASCSTGEIQGVKQESGDKKTPEGIYFLNDEYEDRYLSPIYGKKAFPTDYPNLMDQRAGKNGSAIWIHGTNKPLKPMDSNGCVVLENNDILRLADHVSLNTTPVIMVESVEKTDEAILTKKKKAIRSMVSSWLAALETGTYHDYLAFFSPDYLPDIAWWQQWHDIKSRLEKKRKENRGEEIKLAIDNVGIYFHDQTYLVLFDMFLNYGGKIMFLGKRKLFLTNTKSEYLIAGDVFQTIAEKLVKKSYPLTAAAVMLGGVTIEADTGDREKILDVIEKWLNAWSSRDMETYGSFYADNFFSDGMNRKRWIQKKRMLADKYSFIRVTGDNFKINRKKDQCEVTFFQEYASDQFKTEGIKKLKLVNKGGIWMIYQESWKRK